MGQERIGTLAGLLDRMTIEGELYDRLPEGRVRCYACGHRCTIFPGKRGICKVRLNEGGTLRVPSGYVGALQCDPTEKKPFNHVLPGSLTLTFGMLGCDFHCPYCQNWITSQALRDSAAGVEPVPITPAEMVRLARRHGARLIGSSYNEPLITSEWAVAIFKQAKEAGLRSCYISNGNATPEVLQYLHPWTDCYKIDLKAFNDRNYRLLGGTLESVTRSIRMVYEAGFWIEVVTLLIPGYNDSRDEMRGAAEFIASVSPFIPWHVTAFHKDYKMTEPDDTPPETLVSAARIGEEAGLKYVYAGNLPGRVGKYEHTFCHQCSAPLVERFGYRILHDRLGPNRGRCPECGTAIPGIWY